MNPKQRLIELVESLFESPEDVLFFSTKNKIVPSDKVLRDRRSAQKELHFKPEKILNFLNGVVDFPAEYIKISVGSHCELHRLQPV